MPKWRWKELCRILSAPSVQLKGYSTGQWHRAARSGQGGALCDRPHDPWRPPKIFTSKLLTKPSLGILVHGRIASAGGFNPATPGFEEKDSAKDCS